MDNETKVALNIVARKLNVPVDWLARLIAFESGFNPTIKNKYSSAMGLIQFVDETARSLGYRDSLDLVTKNPSAAAQIQGPVYQYLKRFAPFPTMQSLAMAVFYPSFRYVSPDTVFPDSVLKANPGIRNPADYLKKMSQYGDMVKLGVLPVIPVVAIFFLIYHFRKGGKSDRQKGKASLSN